jgi:hypothetical protein
MRQQVPMLVNRATLDRYAVPNGGDGRQDAGAEAAEALAKAFGIDLASSA